MPSTITSMIQSLWERMRYGKRPDASKRSPEWHKKERETIAHHPFCGGCGRTDHLEVHHIVAFEDNPKLELVDANLTVLCRPPGSLFGTPEELLGSCHFLIGHVDPKTGKHSWKVNNPNVLADAAMLLRKRQRQQMGLQP